MGHLALALEDHSVCDGETRGQDVAPEDGRPVDFHPLLRTNASADLSADDDGSSFDFAADPCSFSDDQRVRGKDLSPKDTADPHRALKTKLPFEFTTSIDNACNGLMGGRDAEVFWITCHRSIFHGIEKAIQFLARTVMNHDLAAPFRALHFHACRPMTRQFLRECGHAGCKRRSRWH